MKKLIFVLLVSSNVLASSVKEHSFESFSSKDALINHLLSEHSLVKPTVVQSSESSTFAYTKTTAVIDAPVPAINSKAVISLNVIKDLFPTVKLRLDDMADDKKTLKAEKNLNPKGAASWVVPQSINFSIKYDIRPTKDGVDLEVDASNYDQVFENAKMIYHFQKCTAALCGDKSSDERSLLTMEKVFAIKPSQKFANQVSNGVIENEKKDAPQEIARFEAAAQGSSLSREAKGPVVTTVASTAQ